MMKHVSKFCKIVQAQFFFSYDHKTIIEAHGGVQGAKNRQI